MKNLSPGLSDSIACVIAAPAPCPRCASSSRVGGGLCLGCLLQSGLEPEEDCAPETLESALAEVAMPDKNWRLGNYEILEEIGRGGMGVIYRARQRHSRRIVAVKRVLGYHADSRETLARFRREAQAVASLDHPNILPIYEVSESDDGLPFFSMKFAPGGSLAQASSALRREPRQCVALMAKVTRAVQYAHGKGILHRDLKPGNILLDGRGEPFVSDFGLAKWLEITSDLTRTLTIFGTPGYIAPEQASESAALVKPTADVYSLGAILFDLLAGRPPFLGSHALSVIRQAADMPAPKLRSLSKVADRDLQTICARCLEREPQARYCSAGDLAEDLERWLEGRPIIARPILPPMQLWRWARRNPMLAASFLACLFLSLATTLWLSRSQHLAGTVRQQALAANSVAVLPILDLDTAQHDSRLPSAIADLLREGLAPLTTARVALVANNESWVAGTGNPTDFREAYQKTKSRLFVTGTIRNSHGSQSISLRLINAATGEILWRSRREGTDTVSVLAASAQELISHTYRSFSSDADSHQAVNENDPAISNPAANDFIVSARQLMLRMTVGDFDRSLQCLQRAINLAPRSATAHAYFAIAAAGRTHFQPDEGLLRGAENEARKAIELDPDSALSHRALSGVLYQQRQFTAALEEQLRAIEAGGAEERSATTIGMILLKLGLPARALVWFSMAQHWATLPGDHDAWIGDCWSALCDDERAEAAYRRCMELRPELADGWVGLCHLRLLQRDPRSARALFAENSQRFKSYNDSNHDPELLRAAIEFYDRNYVEAERLYREIEVKHYGSQEGFYGAISDGSALGRLRQLLGDEKEGRAILERQLQQQVALASQSQDPALLYEIAAIEASLDHPNQALDQLRTAIDKGWIDVRTMQIDPRFDSLVVDARYQSCITALFTKIEQMKQAQNQSIKLESNSEVPSRHQGISMNNDKPRRMWDQHGKPPAIVDVLTHIMSQTAEEGQQCVDNDSYARQLFEDPDLGNITVPNNVRLVFVPTGDRDKGDAGSVVIELPNPASGAVPGDQDLVRYPDELEDRPRNWDKFGKCAAIRDVIRHITSHPEVGPDCLKSGVYSRKLFQTIGEIQVPNDVKVVFVPAGEKESLDLGSLIIELPAPGPVPPQEDPNAPHPLLAYALCCYSLW